MTKLPVLLPVVAALGFVAGCIFTGALQAFDDWRSDQPEGRRR